MVVTTQPTLRLRPSPRRAGGRQKRRGFTLVELLVAMALIIFIMVILTEAFSAGTGVFRTLKAQGDMTEKLRNATTLLREDLRQQHFDVNHKKLSNLFTSPVNVPEAGYFHIQSWQCISEGNDGSPIPRLSYRMDANNRPALCFSMRRNGIQPSDYFSARIYGQQVNPALAQPNTLVPPPFSTTELLLFGQGPVDYQMPRTLPNPNPFPNPPPPQFTESGTMLSLWAEAAWFLTPKPVSTSGANGLAPMQLFTLRRRIRVVVPDDPAQAQPLPPQLTSTLNSNSNNPSTRVPINVVVGPNNVNLWANRYAEVSCSPDVVGGQPTLLYFNSPSDLMNPNRQVMPNWLYEYGAQIPGMNPPATDGPSEWLGDDIVLPDVVSFNVRILAVDNTGNGNYSALNGGTLASNRANQSWLVTDPPDFLDVAAANAYYPQPANFPTITIPTPPNPVYNTGNYRPGNPPPYLIKALEITIRVWDSKTSQTRQITIVQEM